MMDFKCDLKNEGREIILEKGEVREKVGMLSNSMIEQRERKVKMLRIQ